jgi:hypothetical protein
MALQDKLHGAESSQSQQWLHRLLHVDSDANLHLSLDDIKQFTAFIIERENIFPLHWDDGKLGSEILIWKICSTPTKIVADVEDPVLQSDKKQSPWNLFVKRVSALLSNQTGAGKNRISFASYLRKIKDIDAWADDEIVLAFSVWIPPVKTAEESSSASGSIEDDPMMGVPVKKEKEKKSKTPKMSKKHIIELPAPTLDVLRKRVIDANSIAVSDEAEALKASEIAENLRAKALKSKHLLDSCKAELEAFELAAVTTTVVAPVTPVVPVAPVATSQPLGTEETDTTIPLHQKRKKMPKHIKTLVWNTHIGNDKATAPCCSCRKESISIRSFHCGHVLAEACGGDTTITNLRPICAACNGSMGTRSMNEFTKEYFGWTV